LIVQVAFLFALLYFHKAAFKFKWGSKVALWGTLAMIVFMLFTNGALNYMLKLKYLSGFYIAGIHFSMCLKFFSFGHVLSEVHEVIKALKNGTFDKKYDMDDINETVN